MAASTTGRYIVEQPGPPEAMRWVEEALATVGAGEVLIRHEAIGVDFIDTQIRSGLLPAALPTGLGLAGVGIAEEVGADVTHVKRGERVAYVHFVAGSYAERRIVPAQRVIALPDQQLAPEIAAGALFRGLTAWYLSTRLRDIKRGDIALVHAAAGGVGLILTQWLQHLGATVIATVGHADKAQLLHDHGCEHVVVIPKQDFVAKVAGITAGRGADIVYDSVGKATFEGSLKSTRRFGLVVSYGWASGDPELSLMALRNAGSLFITRPTISHYTAEADDFRRGARELFGLVRDGALRITVGNRYPLRDAARAHADLAAGRTVGSVVLLP